MLSTLSLILSGALAHLATNLDNLLALIALIPGIGALRAIGGWALAQAVVLTASVLLAEGAEFVIGAQVGLLGIVPILIGARLLWQRRGPEPDGAALPMAQGTLSAMVLFLSLSGDTLAVFAPLLADTAEGLEPAILLGAGLSLLAMSATARLVSQAGRALERLTRAAEAALPFLMIALGLYVLMNTLTD